MKTALIILGMHRSGTSALTRVLNLLGAAVPKNLLPGRDENDLGFWESEDLMTVHDELLALGRLALGRRLGTAGGLAPLVGGLAGFADRILEHPRARLRRRRPLRRQGPAGLPARALLGRRPPAASARAPRFVIPIRNPLEVAALAEGAQRLAGRQVGPALAPPRHRRRARQPRLPPGVHPLRGPDRRLGGHRPGASPATWSWPGRAARTGRPSRSRNSSRRSTATSNRPASGWRPTRRSSAGSRTPTTPSPPPPSATATS